ncbi:voltage-dependent anion-selective channel-like isoform X1 [Anopheles ziemanni]|uniref:voltage-dependent anion-selective channel-like isoform X1 n=1 Tax=Anopheles coustani TaxID=139045 RepID=UPI002658D3E1|nr:voltage-dependent anion-selective channel-like isoform X1 [Anopheles coustani]XP_058167219.1 voltage-dependent anion-selective channel-like isoform X1 [Anopheles ziemanni]
MAPPAYSDLGKQARDVFNKGYHFGLWKLDVKTKTNSGVEFSTSGHSNQDTGKVFGSLETKYKVKEYGLNFSEKWNTDNTLTSEVSVENQLVKGLKVSFDGMFVPHTGYVAPFGYAISYKYRRKVPEDTAANTTFVLSYRSKTGRFKTAYSHDRVRVDADFNVDLSGPLVNASGVAGYQGWLAGYQVAFDSQKSKITANNFALGYSAGDFVLHTNVNDGREFGGLIYQRCNDRLETAVQLSWASGSNATKFGMAAKYDLDKDASVRAKVNNQSQIGLGYQQKLRDGITLTLSTLVDGKNFNAGGHKIGVALELEA